MLTWLILLACTAAAESPAAAPPVTAPAEPPGVAVAPAPLDLRLPTDYSASRSLSAASRIALSAKRRPVVEALFDAAGVTYPPSAALFRVFKAEGELEVWAGPSATAGAATPALMRVATWRICAQSGDLGPKRREGDGQVPEGFYTIDLFNSLSAYHLSMRVGYPNASDKVLSDRDRPGGDIMIHGDCVSIGCLAMTDERIEELWDIATAVRDRKGVVRVHILPARDLAGLLASAEHPDQHALWANLAEGDAIFQAEHRAAVVSVDAAGRYHFR